ncbi:hypothetical protein LJR296_007510 [Cupriavidus necator]|uniref:hypothetical protein n=1 Tax=Cupriavidus necator TaxID=106590 RepID=UPI003ECD46E4
MAGSKTAKYFSYINVIDLVVKRMALQGRGTIVNIVGMGGKMATPHRRVAQPTLH